MEICQTEIQAANTSKLVQEVKEKLEFFPCRLLHN